jgi:hypothetical protein
MWNTAITRTYGVDYVSGDGLEIDRLSRGLGHHVSPLASLAARSPIPRRYPSCHATLSVTSAG